MRTKALFMSAALLAACEGAPASDDPGNCPSAPGTICTVAGNGVAGDGEDGLLPRRTMLYAPADVAFAPDGAMVIVDWNNHRIRAVQPGGRLKIVAGEGELGGGLENDDVTGRLNHPTDVTFDHQGRMVIAAWHNSRIKRVDMRTRAIEDIAGTGGRAYGGDGGPATAAILNLPVSVVFAPDGQLYVSDQANQRIRCIDTAGIIRTVAGTGERGFAGDGGPAPDARFDLPVGQRGHPAGHITRDAAGNMYLADTLNNRIRHISPDSVVSTVAGVGTAGSGGDGGPALEAQLNRPVDVAIGPEGALYIADTDNDCVRAVAGGVIRTVAGVCGLCRDGRDPRCSCPATDAACLGDGGPAHQALLRRPTGIALDREGNLFVADTLNHRIRVVRRSGS